MDGLTGGGAGGQARDASHPELVVVPRGALLDEGPVVGGDVAVVRVFFQHVDLLLDLFLLILGESGEVSPESPSQPPSQCSDPPSAPHSSLPP